jgi:hypothetical protein
MPELLELAQFLEDDAVAEVEVGGGGIDAEFGAERGAALEFLEQFALAEDAGGAAGEDLELFGGGFHRDGEGESKREKVKSKR